MSKNVAVFVDVANIFYAAKAAGVDIDYVTLLKSATAGRDFVRAYAYTGLDPENENQRQFHAFLARSGYKVVSKDIRKYGDGRVKANLDIELVVDLMRLAEHLDIAVVISGDGDFAPAIYAVQQRGVRVEVISFRGNTSSDLIDAADVFIDIATVAKVEKGVRSGRRVATDGDLSMTEVPDKESGVTPRRRRREAEEKPERPVRRRSLREPAGLQVASVGEAAGDSEPVAPAPERSAGKALVALPGEKLTRGAAPLAPPDAEIEVVAAETESTDEASQEEGRRRRRRRGGRGRGRGAQPGEVGEAGEAPAETPGPEVAEFADEVPPLPQHAGFGSVWDSQIGMPRSPRQLPPAASRTEAVDDLDEPDPDAEPEVPEYMLAERRQQDRPRGSRGARTGGYRTAIDRERYGSGPRPSFGRSAGRPGKPARPMSSGRASVHAMEPIEQTPGGDPWSEVPPEVQELLRAEVARRQAASGGQSTGGQSAPRARHAGQTPSAPAAGADAGTASDAAAAPATPAAEAAPKRTPRRRSSKAAVETATEVSDAPSTASDAAATPATPATPAAEAAPKRTPRRRSSKTAVETSTEVSDAPGTASDAAAAPAAEAAPKRTPRRRSSKATAETSGGNEAG